jgi:hypothetical protein
MAQISANTITYDQIFLKLKSFIVKDFQNEFRTKAEKVEEYNKLLKEIQESIIDHQFYYDPYIKGEPPTSAKLNKFSNNLTDNINSLAKQMDYLNAKTINSFNMFFKEIENEKRYSERIASKARILQMYSESPSNDLFYLGDSFDNYDYIAIEDIRSEYNPMISNGKFTLPIKSFKKWNPSTATIASTVGFLGNNHQVVRSQTATNPEYEYVFEKYPGISLLNNVIDSNPLTYFEYEVLNVDKTNMPGDRSLVSENEFCFIANKKVNNGVTEGELVNWSNYNTENALTMTVVMEALNAKELTNYVEIIPYFGSSNLVKVNQIKVTDVSGNTQNILQRPIYIGSSVSAISAEYYKDYYYNKATVRYSERKTSKIEIIFEQNNIQNIEIQHLYWKPNYPAGSTINSPFVGLARFNPDLLNREIYEEVSYDRKALLPSSSNANEFKKTGLPNISRFKVNLKKKSITYNKWVITFKLDETLVYFFDFIENLQQTSDVDYVITQPLPNSPEYNNGILKVGASLTSSENAELQVAGVSVDVDDIILIRNQPDPQRNGRYIVSNNGSATNEWVLERSIEMQWTDDVVFDNPNLSPKYFESEQAAQQYVSAVQTYIQSLTDGEITYQKNGLEVTSTVSDLRLTNITRQSTPRQEDIEVPLSAQYEVYPAKRLAVGLRDVSVGYEEYSDKAEIVSLPFYFDKPVVALMLSVDRELNTDQSNLIELKYFVSLGDDVWRAISPVQLDNKGIAEVFSMNENVEKASELPGVYYINYPEIPKEVKEIKVRIQINKSKSINITPEIYNYKLIARVKQ